MNEQDYSEIYKVLAPMAGDYANAQAEQIGQAQRSMGTLAGRTMGNSQTAGLGNYTYNRLMRPQVDTMRDAILVKGYTNELNKLLSNALSSAKEKYNNSPKNPTTVNPDTSKNKETEMKNEGAESGYKHAGSADKDTGGWISENDKEGIISGESHEVPANRKSELGTLGKLLMPGVPFWFWWLF